MHEIRGYRCRVSIIVCFKIMISLNMQFKQIVGRWTVLNKIAFLSNDTNWVSILRKF